ncbi:hypothetical protein EON65_05475 [archaeon]|nr:MAG: hypothetical protein EON65_05475 [archaeon]
MGCTTSKQVVSSKYVEKKDTRKSATETKINQALLKKKMEHIISDKQISFEKILLKFDKLRVVLGYVKTIFHEVAEDGKLDHNGLQVTMQRLCVNMTLEDILDLFDFIDVQETNVITMKEFLVALTIGMVLDAIPALATPHDASGTAGAPAKPSLKRSFSGLLGHNSEIKEMLNLIVSAYLIFDPEGKGYIERSSVEKLLDEHGAKQGGGNAMLSQQRWNDMVSHFTLA